MTVRACSSVVPVCEPVKIGRHWSVKAAKVSSDLTLGSRWSSDRKQWNVNSSLF